MGKTHGGRLFMPVYCTRDGDTIAVRVWKHGQPDWKSNHELSAAGTIPRTRGRHPGLFIPDNKWVFVALVLEPAKATLYLGQDGKIASAANTVKHGFEEFNGVTRIGNDLKPKFPPRFFKGAIDDVRIYKRALSASEIEQLASAANPN
jgi:hypothetical protein